MTHETRLDREFRNAEIRPVEDSARRGRLLALASPMLEWRPTPGIASFPYLKPAWVSERGWVTGLKYWADAKSFDEEAWCQAAASTGAAGELTIVLPKADWPKSEVFEVPLRPAALKTFFIPYSVFPALIFPEGVSFVLYKDDGETLVPAGPPAFVQAAIPDGPDVAEADYRGYAESERYEPARLLMLDMLRRYGGRAEPD